MWFFDRYKNKLYVLCLLIVFVVGCGTPSIEFVPDPLDTANKKQKNSTTQSNVQANTTTQNSTQAANVNNRTHATPNKQGDEDGTVISQEIKALRIPELNLDVEARFIPGDKIKIELAGEEEMTREFVISNSGVISYPYAKKVAVVGKTVSEVEEMLVEKLKKYFVEPVMSISVESWAERRVYLHGVNNGKNSVVLDPTRGMTASQFLISAGVSPKEADFNRISLSRRIDDKQKVIPIPLQDLLENYDVKKDIILQPNDMIIVKEAPKIYVQGNVKSPGSFPLQKNEKMNLWYALSLAEGPTQDADLANIKLLRESEEGLEVTVVSASNIRQSELILLEPDDIVVVPSQNENVVTIYGQVKQPGTVKLIGRSVRLSTVIANAGGLTQYASRSIRVFRYSTTGKTQKFSIDFDAITSGDSTQDIEMRSGDVVYCDYGLWQKLIQMENLNLNIRYYLELLYRRKWFIGIIFTLFVVGGVLYTSKQVRLYKTTAVLSITPPQKRNIAGIEVQEEFNAHMQYFVNTQKQILQGEGTMRLLVERLDNDICKEFFGKPKEELSIKQVQRQTVISYRRNTYIFEVGAIGKQPKYCSIVANLLVDIYIEEYNRNEKSLQNQLLNFLSQGLPERKQKLTDAEERLKEFEDRHRNVLFFTNSENNFDTTQIEKLLDKIQSINVELLTKKNNYDKCAIARKKGTLEAILRLEFFRESELLSNLRQSEFELQQKYAENRLRYQPEHRTMVWLNKSIANTKRKIEQEARLFVHREEQEYLGLVYKKQQLEQLLQEEKKKLLQQRQIYIDYQHAKREYDVQLKTYNSFMDKVSEIKAISGYEVNNIRRVHDAVPPDESDIYKPRVLVNYVLSGFLGIFFGIFFVFLLESLDDTIQNEKDMRELVDVPVFGQIPFISKRRYGKNIEKVVVNYGKSPIAEAFRSLSLNILLMENEQKIFAITSPWAGDGKTVITTNICQTLAKSGKKVLLIDADLYKPRISSSFDISQELGFADVIQNKANFEDVVIKLEENLWCLPAGILPQDPHQTIYNSELQQILKDLEDQYDYIIFDTPPVGLISDVLLLANHGAKIFLVVTVNKCKKKLLRNVLRRLEILQMSLQGTIFNNKSKDVSNMDSSYNYYYGN